MRLNILIVAIPLICFTSVRSQDITGYWYSSDRSRIYHVYDSSGFYQALLYKSKRAGDHNGIIVLSAIQKKDQEWHRGFIHAVEDGATRIAKLKLHKDNQNVLILRLNRMWVFPVTLRWYKVKEKIIAGF